eukprot:sb/3466665/
MSLVNLTEFKWYRAFHRLSELFRCHGFEVRLVGGAVRDLLLDLAPRDLDVCTTAQPEELLELLSDQKIRHLHTGAKHGTFTVFMMRTCFEVTSLRCDKIIGGTRIISYDLVMKLPHHASAPVGTSTYICNIRGDFVTKVMTTFHASFEEDAMVRDLTINSMSVDVEGKVYDYYGGREDLTNRTLRFVESAENRITEDPLRILRFFRLASSCDYGNLNAVTDLGYLELFESHAASLITQVSPERVWKEMVKILASNSRVAALDLMDKCGILTVLGFPRQNGAGYGELLEDGLLHSDRETKAAIVLGIIFQNLPTQLEAICDRMRVSNRVR